MAGDYEKKGFRLTILFLVLFSFFMLYFIGSLASYSLTGYEFTHYPHVGKNELEICIEGDVQPTQQSYSITDVNDGLDTLNPFISVNGEKHSYQTNLSNSKIDKKIDNLRLGCNTVSFGSSRGVFRVNLDYQPHFRPKPEYLEVKNLRAGKSNKFFISTGSLRPEKTRLVLMDVTKTKPSTIFDQSFPGSTADIQVYEPGNYLARVQVHDGHLWSDIYETPFSIHVISTTELKGLVRTHEMVDEQPKKSRYRLPIQIEPDDDEASRALKRLVQGAYILTWRLFNYIQWPIQQLLDKYWK